MKRFETTNVSASLREVLFARRCGVIDHAEAVDLIETLLDVNLTHDRARRLRETSKHPIPADALLVG